MICALVVASGAGWEPKALAAIAADDHAVLLKRCVDMADLMAAATAGQADVAVVGLDSPGLDTTVIEHLRRQRVRVVAVASSVSGANDQHLMRASRLGVAAVVVEYEIDDLAAVLASLGDDDASPADIPDAAEPATSTASHTTHGKIITVWGTGGAPGRTTVAAGLAAVLAQRGLATTLVDADPYGGSVAASLGILDEVSGMLSAARLSGAGLLEERLATVQRALAPDLTVVTGLPRPDRWVEVRGGSVEMVAEALRQHGHVVVDTGFSLEDDPGSDFGGRPGRNSMTRGAVEVADEVIVVGSADPVGLARLARALVDLRETRADVLVRVVVNRMRGSLGWAERDITAMVEGFARIDSIAFLPDDRSGADRALVAGRLLTECGDSPLLTGIREVAAQVIPEPAAARTGGGPRRRRAGRARRR